MPARFQSFFLIAACLILFLPGLASLPPTDRDESRFAQATKQMVETGNYVDIRFQDETRYKKPVGIYWLQAASVHLFGPDHDNPIWPYRVPSLIGAMLAVLFTYFLGRDLFRNPEAGLIAALLLACCILLNVEARLAKTDAALLACIVIAQWSYWRLILHHCNPSPPGQASAQREGERLGEGAVPPAQVSTPPLPASPPLNRLRRFRGERGWRDRPLFTHLSLPFFWLAIAAGILIKGPIILLVIGTTILTLCIVHKSARYFTATKPILGIVILTICITPWLLAITNTSGTAFFREALGHDFLNKVASAQESHGAPPGFYLATFFASFWPGSLLAPLAVPFIGRARKNPEITFLLAWLIPSWIIFEFMPTKLVHYTLPMFPAIALLTAGWIIQKKTAHKYFRWLSFLLFAISTILLCIASFMLRYVFDAGVTLHFLTPLALIAFLLISIFLFAKADWKRWILAAVPFLSVTYIGIFQLLLPGTNLLWPAREIQTVLAQHHLQQRPIALLDYSEPSAVFLLGTQTKLLSTPEEAQIFLNNTPRAILIAAHKQKDSIHPKNDFGGPVIARFSGFNSSKGDWLGFIVIARDHE